MNQLGTKLRCATCSAEVVVITPGDGTVACHGAPMTVIAGAATGADAALRGGSRESAPDDR